MEMPAPDASILSRKSRIVARLAAALPKAAVIHTRQSCAPMNAMR